MEAKKPVERDFDLVAFKCEDFCRELSPKVDDEETFELASNNAAAVATEDLLADALLSVIDDDDAKLVATSVHNVDRIVSPTPSDEFTEMKNVNAEKICDNFGETEEDEEENFFVREKKSESPETDEDEAEEQQPIPANLVASPKMVSCFEEMFGPVNQTSIVKSIEFAKQLYGDDDEEDDADVRMVTSGKKESYNVDSSEDDLEFKPAPRRQKRSKKKDDYDDEPGTPASCYADSESSTVDDPPLASSKPEGWSFEADDIDITKLIAEVVNQQQQSYQETSMMTSATLHNVEEKTSLDEIFKFDSELVVSHNQQQHQIDIANANDDYDDDDDDKLSNVAAATNETTDDSENDFQDVAPSSKSKVMSTSLNVTFEEAAKSDDGLRGATSLTQSLVCGSTTSADSSSVGDSPNPKKNKNKSKRKKRR